MTRRLLFISIAVIALFTASTFEKGPAAQAAPPGAATGQVVLQQTCLANGLVQTTFAWNPSGLGSQWIDVSASPVFNGFANFGPLASNVNSFQWSGLLPNTVYYSRVATWIGFWATSDPIAFVTPPCGTGFTPPSNPTTQVLGPNSVAFFWTRGNNNQFFCVDTAFSANDLLTLTNSWRNWGCGTTGTSLQVNSLACGATYYWRVWAWGPGGPGYSTVATFQTPACFFTPPTNPHNFNVGMHSAGFAWDAGANNSFYCVDIARSQSDLLSLSGTWRNFACGTTGTQVTAAGLDCDTTYFWRTWAAGPGTSGYTPVASFQTQPCSFGAPTNLNSSVSGGPTGTKTVTFTWSVSTPTAFSCVDYASSQSDLINFGPTWHNACTTGTTINVVLSCNQTIYWRVFAFWDSQNTAYSAIDTVNIPTC